MITIVGKCKKNTWNHMDHSRNWRGDKRALYKIGLDVGGCHYVFQGFTMCLDVVLRNVIVSNVNISSYVVGISYKLTSKLWGKRIAFPIGWRSRVWWNQMCLSRGRGLTQILRPKGKVLL